MLLSQHRLCSVSATTLTTPLLYLKFMDFKPTSIVCLIPLLSISNHCITSLEKVATFFVMEWIIGPLKSREKTFSIYTKKHYKTWEKSSKHCSSTFKFHKSTLYSYRVRLSITYHISTINLEHLDPTTMVDFGRLFCMEVNRPMRVVFSLLSWDTWKLAYRIRGSPAQTTLCLCPTWNSTCIMISLLYLKYIKHWKIPLKGPYWTWNNI